MWYLILPPLIFLGSLWLLLWFLSKRAADPLTAAKLEGLPAGGRHYFFFREELGLRLLERITQHFKIFSLKLHNSFTRLSRALRERRERLKPKKSAIPRSIGLPAAADAGRAERRPFWQRLKPGARPASQAVPHEETLTPGMGSRVTSAPPLEGVAPERQVSEIPGTAQPVPIRRPSLPQTPAGPETAPLLRRRRPATERHWSEEELIGRIATNPKDAQAYELLGDHYMDGRNLEDAKACYRQVIKLLPLNRDVKEKVRRLERLLTQRGR